MKFTKKLKFFFLVKNKPSLQHTKLLNNQCRF
jgi:hypothetical protein